jgi:hypothetical protein
MAHCGSEILAAFNSEAWRIWPLADRLSRLSTTPGLDESERSGRSDYIRGVENVGKGHHSLESKVTSRIRWRLGRRQNHKLRVAYVGLSHS